ncbi:MAG: hypothetical protein LUI06_03535 [Ruminococcus sp.]|nr:hypothetical protein [Ruminococcus sp.]
MNKFSKLKISLCTGLAAAILLSASGAWADNSQLTHQIFLFPQFASSVAADKGSVTSDSDDDEITYSLGIVELIKRILK